MKKIITFIIMAFSISCYSQTVMDYPNESVPAYGDYIYLIKGGTTDRNTTKQQFQQSLIDSLGVLRGMIAAQQIEIDANTANIATNAGNISTNTGNISTNATNISTNSVAISANADDISDNSDSIAAIRPDVNANADSIAVLRPDIDANADSITVHRTLIDSLFAQVALIWDTIAHYHPETVFPPTDQGTIVWSQDFETITTGYTVNHYLVHNAASGDSLDNYFDIEGEGIRSASYGVDVGDPDPKTSIVALSDSMTASVTSNALQLLISTGTGGPSTGVAFTAVIPAGYDELYCFYDMWLKVDNANGFYDPTEFKVPHFNSGVYGANDRFNEIIRNGLPADTLRMNAYVNGSTGVTLKDPASIGNNFNWPRDGYVKVKVGQRVSITHGFVQYFLNDVCVGSVTGETFTGDIDEWEITIFESNTAPVQSRAWFDNMYIVDPGGVLKTGNDLYSDGDSIN